MKDALQNEPVPVDPVEGKISPQEEQTINIEQAKKSDVKEERAGQKSDDKMKCNKSKTKIPSVKTKTGIDLINHYISVRYDEAGFADEAAYAKAIGDAMIASGKEEEKLLSELKERFTEAIANKIFISIGNTPLIWSQLNPEAVSEAENAEEK